MRTALVRRISGAAAVGVMVGSLLTASPAAAEARWEEVRRRCFETRAENHTVRTHCFNLLKLRDDGNNDRDYWTMHHWGTARSQEGYAMKVFRLRAYPHEDSPPIRNWADWSPRSENHTVRTHCFTLFKLRDDGNNDRDYWTLHHWGTARSQEGYGMKLFRLRVYPHEDSPRMMNWADWSPKGDEDRGGCEQITIGISFVAQASWTHDICEEWDITFSHYQPGKFQNIWRPATKWIEDSEREVAYAIAVAVRQGKQPRWHFRGYAEAHNG